MAIRDELWQAAFALAGPALVAAESILDDGCGAGWWLERLAADDRIGARLHGVELLPERVVAAQRRVARATVVGGDARALPYADRSFDVVTLLTVLSSMPGTDDALRALGDARRVLRPGGVLLIWEPRVGNPLNRSTISISRRLLRTALAEAGVESVTTTVLPPLARRLGARTEALYPRLSRIGPLHTHRLVRARWPGSRAPSRAPTPADGRAGTG